MRFASSSFVAEPVSVLCLEFSLETVTTEFEADVDSQDLSSH